MHGVIAFLLSFPLALSHNSHVVAHGDQSDFFASGGFVDVTHGLIAHLVTRLSWPGKQSGHPCQKQLWNSYTVQV